MTTKSEDESKRAGRGGVALLAANLLFLLTGFVQQALLPRAIGRADYGAFSRVSAVSNIFNNVIVSSSIQGVSRVTAAAGDHERQAFRAVLRVHVGIAALATGLLVAAAPVVAHFQASPEILSPLIVISGVLAIYGVYAPLVGYLNGRRQFQKQAMLNVAAALLRTGGMVGVGWLFVKNADGLARSLGTLPGLLGATAGAVMASAGVFLLALSWTKTGAPVTGDRPETVPLAREYLRMIMPVLVAQLFVNALMQADIFLLGRYASLGAQAAEGAIGPGGALLEPGKAANEWVAVYRGCQLFAFLPYQLLFSVTQVLFPMLAKAKQEEGDKRVAELVARGSRIGAIVCGLMVAVIVAMPQPLIRLAYDAEVAQAGAPALRILVLGQGAFAMFGLVTTILVSLGRERAAMALTALALGLLIVSCMALVPDASFGRPQLMASATAVVGAIVLALVAGVFVARKAAGAFVPGATALRVGLAVALAAFAGMYTPPFGKLMTLAVAPLLAAAYLGILATTREIGKADLALVMSIIRPKKT
jgi:stage V sporulation protein B